MYFLAIGIKCRRWPKNPQTSLEIDLYYKTEYSLSGGEVNEKANIFVERKRFSVAKSVVYVGKRIVPLGVINPLNQSSRVY